MDFTFSVLDVPDDLVLPTAIELGYKPMIVVSERQTKTITYLEHVQAEKNYYGILPDGAYDIEYSITGLQEDSDVIITYSLDHEEQNTQTVKEFMNGLFIDKFLAKVIRPAMVKVATAQAIAAKKQAEAALESAEKAVIEQLKNLNITTR